MSPPVIHDTSTHDLENMEHDEEKSLLHMRPKHLDRKSEKAWIFTTMQALLLIVGVMVLITIARLVHRLEESLSSTRYPSIELRKDPCGQTPAAARAAGCTFDLGTAAWLPPDCFDEELHAEFMSQGPWKFYHNTSDFVCGDDCLTYPEPSQLVPLETLDDISGYLSYFVWTDRRYHVSHCMYAWKLMHRQMEKGRKMDQILISWHHTAHCVDSMNRTYMSPEVPLEKVMTAVAISFPNC